MSIKKLNAYWLKNPEAVNDLQKLLNEESVHIELFHQVLNNFSNAKKMNKAFDLMNESGLIQIIEKDFTYKKLDKTTSQLVETTEVRKYYRNVNRYS